MAKELKLNLPKADDLFSTQEERDNANLERVAYLPLDEVHDFPNHPFKVRMDAEMMEMVESVRQHGVLVPGLARPRDGGGHEIVAGHRRKMASKEAELATMPFIIRNLTDDEATIIMVDSNLQRERILPSEKAFAYKMKLDAMKRQQGERTDLTSATVLQKSDGKTSRELIAEKSPDSHEQIRKYIRLTELIPQMLDMVDNTVVRETGKPQISLRPAVELSYLTSEQQRNVLEAIDSEGCTPSHAQAIKMRKFAHEGRLNEDVALSIMQEEKPNQAEQFKMPREKLRKYFPSGTPARQIEETIIKALELLRQRERRRDAR